MIRYACQVLGGVAGDVPHRFMEALAALPGRPPLRAIAIGAADFGCDTRWWKASDRFESPLLTRFVSVVCAPLGLAMTWPALPAAIERELGGRPADRTVLESLHTRTAVANVAIVSDAPQPGAHLELGQAAEWMPPGCARDVEVLRRCELVIVASNRVRVWLQERGVDAIELNPADPKLADQVGVAFTARGL